MTEKKIKPLLSSLREKKRFLAFEILSKQQIKSFKAIKDAINISMLNLFGQFGTAKAGIIVLEERYKKPIQKGLVKVNNKYVNNLKTALAIIRTVDNKKVIFKSIGVSGSLKKAENYLAK